MLPSIFGENLFDDFFDDSFNSFPLWNDRSPLYRKHAKTMMKTDVRDTEDTYELDIDLPGFKKDEISANLENGYLTICASKNTNNDEKDKEGRYIRQERYSGTCSRSFYVGDIERKDVSANYENGILKLSIPKAAPRKELPRDTSIDIG